MPPANESNCEDPALEDTHLSESARSEESGNDSHSSVSHEHDHESHEESELEDNGSDVGKEPNDDDDADSVLDEEEYDFGSHEKLKKELEAMVRLEGKSGMQECDRLATGFIGLINQGATCYLNSLLQSLFFCADFREKVYDWQKEQKIETRTTDDQSSIPLQLQRLFAKLQFSEQTAISTKPLTSSFGWSDSQAFEQHDVQEMCRILFDSLEQYKGGKDFAQPFTGSLVDYIICLKCGHKRAKREEFQDLSLFVQNAENIDGALDKFVEVERLDGDNQYHCEHCKTKVDAIKGHRIISLPNVLMLHMKRFHFDWEIERRVKLLETLEIPEKVDVCRMVGLDAVSPEAVADSDPSPNQAEDSFSDSLRGEIEKAIYHPSDSTYILTGIIVHSGNANSGHYYALARTGRDEWHEFNDTHVTKLPASQVRKMCSSGGMLAEGGAYMVFYTRERDFRPAKGLLPNADIVSMIQRENERRSLLRKVMRMEKMLIKVNIQRGAMVGPAANQMVGEDGPLVVPIELHAKKVTMIDLKHRAYNKLVPRALRSSFPLSSCRLRKIFDVDNQLGEPFNSDSDLSSLQSLGISSYFPLLLEFLRPNQEVFEPFFPTGLQLRLVAWDSKYRGTKAINAGYFFQPTDLAISKTDPNFSIHSSLPPISLPSQATIEDLKTAIHAAIGIPLEEQGIICFKEIMRFRGKGKRDDIDDESMYFAQSDSTILKTGLNLSSGDGVIVCLKKHQSPLQVVAEYKESQDFLTLYFNNPANTKKGSPVNYDLSIKLSRDSTLDEAKSRMIHFLSSNGALKGNPNEYNIRKSFNAPQLKDYSQTLSSVGLSDQSILHLAKGEVIPKDHFMIRVFEGGKESGNVPNLLFRVNVPISAKVDDLREMISNRLGVDDSSKIRLLDKTMKNEAGDILIDGRRLNVALKRFQDGRGIFAQVLESSEQVKYGQCFIKVVHLSLRGGEFEVEQIDECLAEKDWTWRKFQQEVCSSKSIAHLGPQYLKRCDWMDDVSVLEWMSAEQDNESNARLGSMVISRFPMKMGNGSIVLAVEPGYLHEGGGVNRDTWNEKLPQKDGELGKLDTSKNVNTKKKLERRTEKGGIRITNKTIENARSPTGPNKSPSTPDLGMKESDNEENEVNPALQRVPSLKLSSLPAPEERQSYQEEFMSKKMDFSESWREAASEMLSRGIDDSNFNKIEPKERKESESFQTGERVLAKAPEWKRLFPGTIFSFNESDETYTIDFDDGDRLDRVERSLVRSMKENSKSFSSASLENKKQDTCNALSEVKIATLNSSAADSQDETFGSLGAEENLCPVDKRERRKEKIASRDLRLQLMFMDSEEHHSPVKGEAKITDVEEEEGKNSEEHYIQPQPSPFATTNMEMPRAKTSPTRSRNRTYVDGAIKHRRVVSSKILRPKSLEPLAAKPQLPTPGSSFPDRMLTSPMSISKGKTYMRPSRIPRLQAIEKAAIPGTSLPSIPNAPANSSGKNFKSFLPSPSNGKSGFHHAGRKIFATDSRIEEVLQNTPMPPKNGLNPLPPL